ncbi:MAG TPA: prepilin-type N-terminal cleavage/methylation domain-containing protein [Candidatus Polarisedimenticolaceae bacterium]|nr:prepilin-type N-terminal cleavage/methylation domain-containing protein [Candidatus Polarisedimenticolaceae bacterium]
MMGTSTTSTERVRVERGFSLVEVLVALFLIALGVLAAAPMFVYAMQGNATGADFGSVGAIAVERMELLRASSFVSLAAGGSLTVSQSGYSDLSDPDFIVRWRITDDAAPPSVKTITVRAIAVRQVVGQRKEITLTTLRGR